MKAQKQPLKQSYQQNYIKKYKDEHQKIIKAIKNKMVSLNMSPRIKRKHQHQIGKIEKLRPTFGQFSYHQNPNELRSRSPNMEPINLKPNQFTLSSLDYVQLLRKIKKSKRKKQTQLKKLISQQETNNYLQNMKMQRLPLIMQNLQKKKKQFVNKIQNDLLEFQNDNRIQVQSLEGDKSEYNFQYVINRMTNAKEFKKNQIKKFASQKQTKSNFIKGYQNVSPNKLNQYIQLFQTKMKKQPKSIYVSKKRIAFNKNNTQGEQQNQQNQQKQQKPASKLFNLKSFKQRQSKILYDNDKTLNLENFNRLNCSKQTRKSYKSKKNTIALMNPDDILLKRIASSTKKNTIIKNGNGEQDKQNEIESQENGQMIVSVFQLEQCNTKIRLKNNRKKLINQNINTLISKKNTKKLIQDFV